jgi:hypothetical protein
MTVTDLGSTVSVSLPFFRVTVTGFGTTKERCALNAAIAGAAPAACGYTPQQCQGLDSIFFPDFVEA